MASHQLLVAIRQDLVRVARANGRPQGFAPAVTTYRHAGRFSIPKVQGAVGGWVRKYAYGKKVPALSWTAAVRKYGLTPARELYKPTRAQAIDDLRSLSQRLGHGPFRLCSLTEYQDQGRWSPHTVRKVICGDPHTSWYDLAELLGMHCGDRLPRGTLTREKIIRDVRRVSGELGISLGERGPGKARFSEAMNYTAEAAAHHYGGSWSAVLEAAGYRSHPTPDMTPKERRT